MSFRNKKILIMAISLVAIFAMCLISPIAQDASYHNFCDQRCLFGVSNTLNVISNLGFIFIAVYGSYKILALKVDRHLMLGITLGGILFTGLGSSYYHETPNNFTLLFDRLPMTIVFMSFFYFILEVYILKKKTFISLFVLLLLGMLSVLYWSYTESIGEGDLRWYALIQFLPIVLIPVIIILFKEKNSKFHNPIYFIITFYILAKICEYYDAQIYILLKHTLSGHSLKHIFASISAWFIFDWMFKASSN